jgi:two-component system phosphate regulon sensor histidine kinase PhoR
LSVPRPTRRITLYWLLLLVPTLVVGAAAIQLLRREQMRLASQTAEAVEARRATTAARVRLTVETIELIVGDAEAGLLDTLAAEPADGLDAFMDQWERNNPLVRVAFRSAADGRVLRPAAWSQGDDSRGFLRRFPRHFGARPPWAVSSFAPSLSLSDSNLKRQAIEPEERKEIGVNVAQAQSARRDVQELVKSPSYSNAPVYPAAPTVASAGPAESQAFRARAYDLKKAEADQSVAFDARSSASITAGGGALAGATEPVRASKVGNVANVRMKDAPADRRGWIPAMIDGRLHLAGWIQPGGAGEVRGVELELQALISRLGGALPAEAGQGEGYALRDDQGRVLHQVGTIPRGAVPSSHVPLAASLLPGWDVVGYLSLPAPASVDGASVFRVGALLVAIFIAAILAGGSLLLWQARRSDEEAAQKTSFVANVSHEFKTPLTTIRLYAELLEQGRVRDASQGGEYLRTIGRETERLARLVNNALDFSRLEQGRKKYARDRVDLTAALGRLLDTHEPRLREAGLTLERALPAEPVEVATDPDALEQIVLNVLDNACKYASEGHVVRVALARRGASGTEVRIGDRGPGVPPEHRALIFEKFHRVDDALTAEKTGAGLGLSIARQLARGLGGELRYAPREGGGAEFILELP